MKHRIDRGCLGFWTDKEMRIEAAHLLDQCDAVLAGNSKTLTPFLSRALSAWLEGILKREKLAYISAGGFPEPERVRFLIGPAGEELAEDYAGIVLLWVTPVDLSAKLEHRQILGSLIGLGLKREVIGDIRPGKDGVYVAVTEEMSGYLLSNWDKAGREKIMVKLLTGEPDLLSEEGEERRITVASSRVDAVAANGFGVSRTVMQEWISQGRVKRNDLVVSKEDCEVKPGDIISCRGQGRMRLLESQETRKGRIAWNIILYRPHRH